jgi:hypothetical protein
MKLVNYMSYSWIVFGVLTAACTAPTSTRICQLTGTDDRSTPGRPTGVQLGGITGGVTGTDIGWPFEHGGRLHFLFGDTRDFNPDLCEPSNCGTGGKIPPDVLLWSDLGAYEGWLTFHGNSAENMATASLDFDPEQCIPLSVVTELRAGTFAHAMSSTSVDGAIQLSAPAVAANPQDRFVVTLGNRILVVTDDRRVFAHEVVGNAVSFARQLGTLPTASGGERIVPYRTGLQNWLALIASDGRASAVEVRNTSLGPFVPLTGARIAANPEDKWVVSQASRIIVITRQGQVFAHTIGGSVIGAGVLLSNATGPPVAANPQDKYVLVDGTRILVITNVGDVFMHELTSTSVGPFRPLPGPKVAMSPEDNRVLAMDGRILVLTRADAFRPTRLDHVALGRQEGAFTGFSDGPSMFAFFTRKTWPPECPRLEGCAHDELGGPGGKSVLARSGDGLGRFDTMATFSSSKFLFPVPVIGPGSSFPGIPEDLAREQVVLLFGAGRANNTGPNPDLWNESYPYLAVHRLADAASKIGKVYSHPIDRRGFGDAKLFGDAVGARPEDKWVLVQRNRVLVVTTDGRVFQHPIGSSSMGVPIGVPPVSGTIPVAARSIDKWLLTHGDDLLVVTEDGHVFAHRVDGFAHAARELGGRAGAAAPRVGANPDDRWVLVVGDQILVITDKGKVFGHRLDGDVIHAGVELTRSEQNITGGDRDRWVLGMGNDIVIVTGDGHVVTYAVTTSSIVGPSFIPGLQRVAANPEDRWVLGVGSLDQGGRLLVLPYYASGWRYFAGTGQLARPQWTNEERLAQPLAQLGAPSPGSNIAPANYHKCLGYFSVRYLEAAGKWAMLYTCGNDEKHHRPLRTEVRGVFLRTATLPWGPWSAPQRIFDPANGGYCQFMHLPGGPCSSGTNPYESEKGKIENGKFVREVAGEYAPFLLPARFAKVGAGGQADLYYLMSTWNPYQVVLMKTRVDIQ